MKSILYVGATLMIGASIYGFVDYKKTSHKKEFTGMYSEQQVKTPVTEPEKKIEMTIPEKTVVNNKHVTKKNTTRKTEEAVEITPAIKPISDDSKLGKTEIVSIDNSSVDTKIAENKEPVKTIKKKKRLNAELFSRAPIREYTPEKESKKSKDKE